MYHVLYEKRTTNTHSASESIRDLVTLVSCTYGFVLFYFVFCLPLFV